MSKKNISRLGKFNIIKKNTINADDPKENISHTPKGDSKVSKAKIAITNPAAKPLIRGSNFFDIFISIIFLITLYTFMCDKNCLNLYYFIR